MEVRLLGAVEAGVEGRRLVLGGAKQRAVLAMLALRANTAVSMDRLVEGLWGERPPRSAPKMVQSYVSQLRKLLEDQAAAIVTRGRGYELRLPEESVDTLRFERLVAAAERDGGVSGGAARVALALWRGPPLDDLADEPFAAAEIRRLEELWLRARELALDDALAAGEHAAVVGDLQELVAQHQLREHLHAQLMLALYRCGRQAEALEAFREARAVLVSEVGVEPGLELRQLHQAILNQDAGLDLPAPAARRRSETEAEGRTPQILAEPPTAAAVSLPEPLADKVRRAAPSLEGERKQVTVVFCDIRGSMELAASTDPELWRELLDRFLAIVSEAVHAYEGTVNRFTGDGAMALFGAPIAHEDHARRACHAALRLQESLGEFGRELKRDHGLEFAVRLGLNSGEVVVGTVGEDLQMEYTAIGHAVGLAARMQEAAEPGRPYLTGTTAALVDGYFKLDDRGELDVKGAREPVHAFALAGVAAARTRLEAAAGRGLSPLVGRGPELAALEAALTRAGQSGQVVGVVADPGAGKSRLCREFAGRCRQRGMRVTVGGGVAHGQQVPLLPVMEMLRSYFGIREDDDPQASRAKVIDLLVTEDFAELLPVLFEFLGVRDPDSAVPAQMAPEARQRALVAATHRLVEATAGERPGLLVVEDMHWLDAASEAFLGDLIESLPGARTLLLVNFRPEYQADWMRRSYYEQLPLAPLERDQTAQLVEALAGRHRSLDGLAELIAERTGGNPFFIEEVVQGLVGSGGLDGTRGDYRLAHAIDEIQIPASVQALLAARIDRLPRREKTVLQRAAVIGREFSEPVLRSVSGHSKAELAAILHMLAGAELVYQQQLYPEARYAFKHPLTQEVAYRSQLRAPRARTHAAVAGALERADPARHGELAAVISGHWERAEQPLLAAGWGARAAAWEFSVSQPDALRSWRRVRALVSDAPGSPKAEELELSASLWTLHLGGRLGLDEEEAAVTFRRVRSWAEASGDETALAGALAAYGFALAMAGKLREGIALKQEAQRVAERLGDLDLLVTVGPRLLLVIAGRNREAIADFDRLLALAGDDYSLGRALAGHSGVIFLTFARGSALLDLGRLPEARLELEKAVRLAREHDDIETLAFATCQFGYLSFLTGEPGDGLARAREAVEIGERIGNRVWRAVARAEVGLAHLAREEYEQAVMLGEEADAMTQATHGGLQWGGMIHALIASGHLGLGDVDRARAAAAEGVAAAAEVGSRLHEATCHGILGRALTLQDRPTEARAELERALELAGDDGPVIVPHVKLTIAEIAGRAGDRAERLRQLEQARQLFEQQGATGHARRAAAQIATAPS